MKDDRLLEMRVFSAVIDAGGFTAASYVLDVSQSFVSQTVTNLERRLGVALLNRSTRSHRLTDEGQRFLTLCRVILEELEEGEAAIVSSRAQIRGVLRISAPLAFGLDQIVPRIPRFMKMHPDLEVRMALSDAVASLVEENLDVAIRMGSLDNSTLVSRKLCDLRRLVVAAPGYIDINGMPHQPEGLAVHNCLVWQGPQDHLNRWPFLVDSQLQEVIVRGNFGSDNGQTLFQLCLAGVGIMRCAEHLAVPAIQAGLLRPLLAQYQWRKDTAIHAVLIRERRTSPKVRAFVDYLVKEFSNPPWREGTGVN